MSGFKAWSTTAGNNDSASPNGAPENMAPSGTNDTIRENMAAARYEKENGQWFDWGHTPTYISTTSFSLTGDQTTEYHPGRRVRLTDATTLYATILTSVYTSLTTITLTMDSGSVSASLTAVELGILSADNDSIPAGIDAAKLADGTVSNTELQYINSLTSNAQTQINAKAPAFSGCLAYLDAATSLDSGFDYFVYFDQEAYDTASVHDNVTNNERFTVPSGVSYVRFSAKASFATSATGTRSLNIYTSAGLAPGQASETKAAATAGFTIVMAHTPVIAVTPGDYFYIKVSQNSGSAINLNGEAGGYSTWAAMEIVG